MSDTNSTEDLSTALSSCDDDAQSQRLQQHQQHPQRQQQQHQPKRIGNHSPTASSDGDSEQQELIASAATTKTVAKLIRAGSPTPTTSSTLTSGSQNTTIISSISTSGPLRICLIGAVLDDVQTVEAARSFGLPVVTSETGTEYINDVNWTTYFIMREFEGPMFEAIQMTGHRIMGPPALRHHVRNKEDLMVSRKRPIYNYSMKGVITCFTGIREKKRLTHLVNLIHSMGGSIRSGLYSKVTHLICNSSGGAKYQYAMTFRLDVVRPTWVNTAWEQRDDDQFAATTAQFTAPHRLKPFEGQKICFLGFATDEHQHMIEVLVANGGVATEIDDPGCTHVIISNTATHFPDNLSPNSPNENRNEIANENAPSEDSPIAATSSPLSVHRTNYENTAAVHNAKTEAHPGDEFDCSAKENRKRKRSEVASDEPHTPKSSKTLNASTAAQTPSPSPRADGAILTECAADGDAFHHHTTNLSPILKIDALQNIEETSEGEADADVTSAGGVGGQGGQLAKRKRESFDNISLMSTDSMMMAPTGAFSSAKKPKLIRTGSITRGLRRSMSFVALKNPIATVLRSRRNSSVDPNASLTSIGSVDSHTFNESIKRPVAEKMRSLRNRIMKSNKRDITTKVVGPKTPAGGGLVRAFRLLTDDRSADNDVGAGAAGVGDEDSITMATTTVAVSGCGTASDVPDFKTPHAPRSQSRQPQTQSASTASTSRTLFARSDMTTTETATIPNLPLPHSSTLPTTDIDGTGESCTETPLAAPALDEKEYAADVEAIEKRPEQQHQHQQAVTDTTLSTKPEPKNENTHIVKPDWFWYSIQNGFADENEYLYKDYLESIADPATPSADRRESLPVNLSHSQHHNKGRKRKLLSQKVHDITPSGSGKRRSSVSDAGLLSASGSLLDYTASPSVLKFEGKKSLDASSSEPKKKSMRYNHFMDLFATESNYVGILRTIVSLFQKPLEEMADQPGALINKSEVRAIFNNFSPIHDVHQEMLNCFTELHSDWSEDCRIGKIIIDHREALIKAYPPYVNFFEQMRDALVQCDTQNPRFHAFLKINQSKAECGRQTLQDLMIRPVQRLPSISLLISDILKHTPKTNPDHKELENAQKAIKEVMTYINEDKRKMEGRLALFDIFNDIEGCPPDLVASHRKFVSKCEVTELSNSLSGRDDALMLFLFTDYMEVCKIKKSRFNNVKSPITNSTATLAGHTNGHHHGAHTTGRSGTSHPHQKSYKHVKLLPLKSITTVCDLVDGPRAFALCAAQKDKVYAFNINDEVEKCVYLKGLCKQLAEKACTTDADQFMRTTESVDLNIDINDMNLGTLKKAFNYARTRLKVTRAFSFNKTPMKLIKRPVMSPQFGSTNSLTPATQLAKMKLASCTNINEVGGEDDEEDDDDDCDAAASGSNGGGGSEDGAGSSSSSSNGHGSKSGKPHHLVAPLSVQPTRKAKGHMDAMRRL